MIHRLRHMIGSAQVGQSHPTMGYVRAVPCPFYGGLFDRLRDARAVIAGKAFAVRWPEGGELEMALCEGIASLRLADPRPTETGSLDRLREAITKADLQIGDGHIEAARATLHAAMDEASTDTGRPPVSNGHELHAFKPSKKHPACDVCGYPRSERLMHPPEEH